MGVVARSLRTQQRAYGRYRLPARRFGACWAATY
jgi:hypothetical protein